MGITTETWQAMGDYAFVGVAVSAGTFSLLYLVLSPWWKTSAGRNIMAVMGLLAILTIYFAWAINRGGVPAGFWPVRALGFTAFALAIAWRVVIFIRAHLLARLSKKENEHDDRLVR